MNDSSCKIMLMLGSLLACGSASAIPASNALPSGETVVFGSASFDRSVANQLTIKQTSSKLISNWDSFNIGSAATVNFVQPTINSRALNRISASAPSEIFGKLNANGQVFLVNPAGITFGRGSQVQTGTLLASVLDITDRNFIANTLSFERGSARGQINNQGTLLAKEGNVTLLGPTLQNSGSIESSKGNIFLANGDKLAVFDHNIALQKASSMISLIRSTGNLTATRVETRKGQVMLLGEQTNSRSKIELAGNINSQNAWARANQLYINSALSSTGNTALESTQSIYLNAPLTASGNGALLSLVHGNNTGDDVQLGTGQKINMTGLNPYFRINGVFYKVVQNINDLQAIGANSSSMSGKYVLGMDIDASATATWDDNKGFMPIGNFSGLMNGLGHTISGLFIKRAIHNVALFGSTASTADIRHLKMDNVNISGPASTAALVSLNFGKIYQSHVQGRIDGGSSTGGLVGDNYGLIENSSSSGEVIGNYEAGGLVGYNEESGIIRNSLSSSHVDANIVQGMNTGGLVGWNEGTIDSSKATGVAEGNEAVAGFVGYNAATGVITNSKSTGRVVIWDSIYPLGSYGDSFVANNEGIIMNSKGTGGVFDRTYDSMR